ncbi:hypothetical protein U1Q18_031165 [Sarracenia purpurea var. burkii]
MSCSALLLCKPLLLNAFRSCSALLVLVVGGCCIVQVMDCLSPCYCACPCWPCFVAASCRFCCACPCPSFSTQEYNVFAVQVFAGVATELPMSCSALLLCKPLLLNAFDLLMSCCVEILVGCDAPWAGCYALCYVDQLLEVQLSYYGILVLHWVCCSIHGCATISMVSNLWLEVFVQWVFYSVFVLLEVFKLQALVALSWSAQFNSSYVFGLLGF